MQHSEEDDLIEILLKEPVLFYNRRMTETESTDIWGRVRREFEIKTKVNIFKLFARFLHRHFVPTALIIIIMKSSDRS